MGLHTATEVLEQSVGTGDRVIVIEPSYGMYRVCADINNVAADTVLLDPDFSLNARRILEAARPETKLVFLCSPNNPTSNLLERAEIIRILEGFRGIVIVDEAYVDFSPGPGLTSLLKEYRNLVLLRTLSKAWGLAGIRVGVAMGDPEIMGYMNKVKYPYNLNILSQHFSVEFQSHLNLYYFPIKIIIIQYQIPDLPIHLFY